MHRIDTPGAGIGGVWVTGNPVAQIPSTIIGRDFLEATQEELAYIVEQSGAALNKGDNTQVRAAIAAMIDDARGGLALSDRAGIDAIAPIGLGPDRLVELWSAVRWRVGQSNPGWRFSTLDGGLDYTTAIGATFPARYLAEGCEIDIVATGVFLPGSSNPALVLQVLIGGEMLKPDGAQGATGWNLSNGTIGSHILIRYPQAGARWILRLRIVSLGADAAAHPNET